MWPHVLAMLVICVVLQVAMIWCGAAAAALARVLHSVCRLIGEVGTVTVEEQRRALYGSPPERADGAASSNNNATKEE